MEIKMFPSEYKQATNLATCMVMATRDLEAVTQEYQKQGYELNWILSLTQIHKILIKILDVVDSQEYRAPGRPKLREEIFQISQTGYDAIICSQADYLFYSHKDACLYGTEKPQTAEVSRVWYVKRL